MTRLALSFVMATLVSQSAACVIETRDHDHGGGGGAGTDVAAISARWAFRNMADGATTACPAGFDTIELFTQPVDDRGAPLADPGTDLFDCDARTGLSADLPPDLYQAWIEVWSHDLTTRYAQSLSQVLDVRTANQSFSTDLLNDGGYFQLAWDLVAKSTHRPLDCSQVSGADSILAVSTSVADAHRIYDDRRSCADGAGVTAGLLHGTYTITIEAMAGDRTLGAAATLNNQVIGDQNRITDLGTIPIPIDGL
jgi:hypothetical protein